ncbi:MAG: SDR family NAD(P)-dependent oxidoreductase [Kangiellaceae bacterium]
MKELAGKTAIISGGAEGIGFAIAKELGGHGMNLVIADINKEQLEESEQKLANAGFPVLATQLDVVDDKQWQTVLDAAEARFGNIHLLVNNAGVGGTSNPIERDKASDWRWVVDVNLMGVAYGTQAVIPRIKSHNEGGWIINVASMAGFSPLPLGACYSATKAAVVAMSESWHFELKEQNIHVSVLCPAFVKTRINQSHRNRQEQYVTDSSLQQSTKQSSTSSSQMTAFAEKMQNIIDDATPADLIAKRTVEALAQGELYIITHPNFRVGIEARFKGITDAFKRAEKSPLLAEIAQQRMPDMF